MIQSLMFIDGNQFYCSKSELMTTIRKDVWEGVAFVWIKPSFKIRRHCDCDHKSFCQVANEMAEFCWIFLFGCFNFVFRRSYKHIIRFWASCDGNEIFNNSIKYLVYYAHWSNVNIPADSCFFNDKCLCRLTHKTNECKCKENSFYVELLVLVCR